MIGVRSQCRPKMGFTIYELLTVLGILLVLMAILIPSLSAIRMNAQAADTQAHLAQISAGCLQYYQLFNAYPGPVAETTVAGTANFSGNQNLLIGLSRKWSTSTFTDAVELSDAGIFADGKGTLPPTDWSRGTGVPYEAFAFKSSDFHPTSKIATFPILVDRFRDGMPLLYFRQRPGRTGMDETVAAARAFEPNANRAFFGLTAVSNLKSTMGAAYTQKPIDGNYEATSDKIYKRMLGNDVGGTWMPKGSYVIISAGKDHLYGTADDIIMAGR